MHYTIFIHIINNYLLTIFLVTFYFIDSIFIFFIPCF